MRRVSGTNGNSSWHQDANKVDAKCIDYVPLHNIRPRRSASVFGFLHVFALIPAYFSDLIKMLDA